MLQASIAKTIRQSENVLMFKLRALELSQLNELGQMLFEMNFHRKVLIFTHDL